MPKQIKFLGQKGKTALILLVLTCAIITSAVGGTVAYLIVKTGTIKANFTPAVIESAVSQSVVTNVGDVDSYVRAMVIITWVSEDGSATHAESPVHNTDYAIFFSSDGWVKGSDGFYYYTSPLMSGRSTPALITSCTQLRSAPEGYKMKVQVLASTIQSHPLSVVTEQWGVSVNDDGTLSVN